MAKGLGAKLSTIASAAPLMVEIASPAMITIEGREEPARASIRTRAMPAPSSPASAGAISPAKDSRPK